MQVVCNAFQNLRLNNVHNFIQLVVRLAKKKKKNFNDGQQSAMRKIFLKIGCKYTSHNFLFLTS